MDICLCDISAIEAMRSSGMLLPELLERPRSSQLEGCGIPGGVELEDLLAGTGVRTSPVHLMVANGGSTYGRPGVVRHRRAHALPRGSLVRVGRGVLAAGPELALCQAAARDDHDLVDVAQLAYELCGTYLLDQDPNSWKGFVNNDVSATSVAKLLRFLESSCGEYGVPLVRKALGYVRDGSHSPMETVLALLLGLPRSVGGLGIKGISMNRRVRGLDRKIDVALEAYKAGLEYKGRAYHTIEQSARDDRRQNEIVGSGWTILNVWYEDLANDYLFSVLVDSLFKIMGRRYVANDRFLVRQEILRRRLLR